MARIWSSGFETQLAIDYSESLQHTGAGISISTAVKRSGNASQRFYHEIAAASNSNISFAYTVDSTYYVRFYLLIASAPSANTSIAEFTEAYSQSTYCGIKLNTNRTLELYYWNSSGVVATIGSASSALELNTWYLVEMKIVDNTLPDMSFEARLSGVAFASGSGAVMATHEALGNFYFGIDAGGWGGDQSLNTATADLYFDDLAINDSSGSYQTGYPGNGSIVHLHPNAAGDDAATTGTYADIDEVPPDDATSYIEIDTDIHANYGFTSSASAGIKPDDTITLVQVGSRQRCEGTGTAVFNPEIKSQSAGTIEAGTWDGATDSTTWISILGNQQPTYYNLTSYQNPQAAGSWTPALLDTVVAGVEASLTTDNLWITNLWVLVEYIPKTTGSSFLYSMI
jgi:hypothetical protein